MLGNTLVFIFKINIYWGVAYVPWHPWEDQRTTVGFGSLHSVGPRDQFWQWSPLLTEPYRQPPVSVYSTQVVRGKKSGSQMCPIHSPRVHWVSSDAGKWLRASWGPICILAMGTIHSSIRQSMVYSFNCMYWGAFDALFKFQTETVP